MFRPSTASLPANARPGRRARPARSRGSVLLVAMLLAVVIGISLTSFIKLAMSSATLADRSFYQMSAVNAAEMGLEEALYCYNRLDENSSSPTSAWTGTGVTWTIAGDNSVTGTIGPITLGNNVTANAKVYCEHYNPSASSNPKVVVRAIVTMPRGPAIEKWIEITLRKRSLWANGMVGREGIVWHGGNSTADSWDSDPDNNSATAAVPYTTGPVRAKATIGSTNDDNGAVDVAGGTVRGQIMTGGGSISHSSGAILTNSATGTGWNTSLESDDFSATFPAVTVPSPSSSQKNSVSNSSPISFPSTLPRTGDVAWNGVYYYDFASGWGLSQSGGPSNILTISGAVVFLATNHNGVNAIDLGGNANINVASTGSLKVYTNGNIEAAGNGMTNANASPATMQIYGTNTTAGGQTIRYVGNGSSSSAIYAPNANFELKGNGELFGAVVGYSISMNGNTKFHYDEALGDLSTGNPWGIVKWRELQLSADRSAWSTQLNF